MRKYNAFVLGAGEIRTVGFNVIARLMEMGEMDRIFVYDRNYSRAAALKEGMDDAFCDSDKELIVLPEEGGIRDALKDADVSIFSIGGQRGLERLDELKSNLEATKQYAELHKEYKGNSIIVTNPVDIISYVWCLYSRQSPDTVIGLNHLDSMRYRNILFETLSSEIESRHRETDLKRSEVLAYCIGPHDEKTVPYITGTMIRGLPLDIFKIGSEEFYEKVRRAIDARAREERIQTESTAFQTSHAVKETVEAMIYGNKNVTASTFQKLSERANFQGCPGFDYLPKDRGVFIGDIVGFEDSFARPLDSELEGWTKQEFIRTYIELHSILDGLRQGTLRDNNGNILRIKNEDVRYKEVQRTLGHIIESPAAIPQDLGSGLREKYQSLVSNFGEQGTMGPERVKKYVPGHWKWSSRTFRKQIAAVFQSRFGEAETGQMLGFTIHARPENPGLFLGVWYFKHSKEEIATVYQTNDADYAQRYPEKFGR